MDIDRLPKGKDVLMRDEMQRKADRRARSV